MPKKVMVTLYYSSAADARTDCDAIGVSRRYVRTVRRNYSEDSGHYGMRLVEGNMTKVKITNIIRVSDEKLSTVDINKLHHVDDEADW